MKNKKHTPLNEDYNHKVSMETLTAQAMGWTCPLTGAIIPPIHVGTTYIRNENYEKIDDRGYIRDDNPTFEQAETLLQQLEKAKDAILFSSGIAACCTPFQILPYASHIIIQDSIYFGLSKWIKTHLQSTHNITYHCVKTGCEQSIADAIKQKRPDLIWIETPSNPYIAITDIEVVANMAHKAGAYLCVDSTLASPVHTQPLALGADFVIHSATKIINGHSDVLAGFIACREKNEFWEKMREHRYLTGSILGSFESFLLVRGMRTLFLRAKKQSESAFKIAEHFHSHPFVKTVLYPGLAEHQNHKTACKQMKDGFGYSMSFLLKGNNKDIFNFLSHLKLIKRATSLGGIETLIEHRKTIEGGDDSNVADNLLRLSIGIEDSADIIADLEYSFKKAFQ